MRIPFLHDVLEGFRSSWLAVVLGLLFLADLAVPDLLPGLDEAALAVATLLLARWRGRRARREAPRVEKPPIKNVTPKA